MKPENLRVLVVEDDLSFQLGLEMILDELGYGILPPVDNSADALDTILSEKPDLILMDIDIHGKLSGLEVADRIKHLEIPILFITSHDNPEVYAAAKQTFFAGYIVKPMNRLTLESALDLIVEKITRHKEVLVESKGERMSYSDTILVKKKHIFQKLNVGDIQYVQASGNFCMIITQNTKYSSRFKITALEELLPTEHFIRVHRSYIMNIHYFESLDTQDQTIAMKNGDTISINRANKEKLLEMLRCL